MAANLKLDDGSLQVGSFGRLRLFQNEKCLFLFLSLARVKLPLLLLLLLSLLVFSFTVVVAAVADTGLNFIAELESSSLTVLHYCNEITIIKAAIMELKL